MTDYIFPKEHEIIYEDGTSLGYLNSKLISKRGLSLEIVEELKKVHCQKHKLWNEMKNLHESGDFVELKKRAIEATTLEYKLQELWGFELDESFHPWFRVPGCTCPKLDNADRAGTKYRIVNSSCPLHGVP